MMQSIGPRDQIYMKSCEVLTLRKDIIRIINKTKKKVTEATCGFIEN